MVEGEIDPAQVKWMTIEIARQLHQLLAQGRVRIDAEVGPGDIRGGLGTTRKGLQRMETAGTEAPALRERPQGRTILGTAEVDRGLARRGAEGIDHLGRQRQDDVVGYGEDRQVGQVNGRRPALAGPWG